MRCRSTAPRRSWRKCSSPGGRRRTAAPPSPLRRRWERLSRRMRGPMHPDGSRVTFRAGIANGTASIAAASGGASTGADGAVRIAIGAAAVGQVVVGASPTTISCPGRHCDHHRVRARHQRQCHRIGSGGLHDHGGTLAATSVLTDRQGRRVTTLTTSVQATVTATAGISSTGTGPGRQAAHSATGGIRGTGGTGGTALEPVPAHRWQVRPPVRFRHRDDQRQPHPDCLDHDCHDRARWWRARR